MQITTISVEGFRSLFNVQDVAIRSQTILTGQNDGGKTAILDALTFLVGGYDLSNHDLSYLPGQNGNGTEEQKRVEKTLVTGTFELSPAERVRLHLPERIKIRRTFDSTGHTALEVRTPVCAQADLRNLEDEKIKILRELAVKYGLSPTGPGNVKGSWLEPLQEYAALLPTIEDWAECRSDIASAMPTVVYFRSDITQPPDIAVQDILGPKLREYTKTDVSQSKIRELEDYLNESLTPDIDRIREHVTRRCDLPSVQLNPRVQVRPTLTKVEFTVAPTAGQEVPLSSAGTGRSRRISLALWETSHEVLRETGSQAEGSRGEHTPDIIFLYDEPDTHLDYAHQRRIMNLIEEQSSLPNARVVVATHSLNLIDGVDISNIAHVRSADGSTYVEVISEDSGDQKVREHLSDIAAALGFRNSVLLHERFFVAVEGISEYAAFPILFKKHSGLHIQSAGICLWNGGNNEGALKFARFLKDHRRDVSFVVDKDSRQNRKKIFRDDKLKEYGFSVEEECYYLGTPNELEDLFSDESWAATANEIWPPSPERGEWTTADFTQHRGSKFSTAIWRMLKSDSPVGPSSKEEMMIGISSCLGKNEIPREITAIFDALAIRAEAAGPHNYS